jgi:hypothetical protein
MIARRQGGPVISFSLRVKVATPLIFDDGPDFVADSDYLRFHKASNFI